VVHAARAMELPHGSTSGCRGAIKDGKVTASPGGDVTKVGDNRFICGVMEDGPTTTFQLVPGGDGVADIDIAALIRFHKSHGKAGTLTGVHPPGRFGELTVKKSAAAKFNEKPKFSGGYINGGFFVFNADVFDRYLNDREDLILKRDPLHRMAADGQLMMYQHEGFWHHVDTPHGFDALNDFWKSDNAPWKIWK